MEGIVCSTLVRGARGCAPHPLPLPSPVSGKVGRRLFCNTFSPGMGDPGQPQQGQTLPSGCSSGAVTGLLLCPSGDSSVWGTQLCWPRAITWEEFFLGLPEA